jgi:uncharacterized protein YecT (DUF1311 family)
MRTLTAATLAAACLLGNPAGAQSAAAFMANPAFQDPPPARCDTTFDLQHCAAHDLRVADKAMSRAYFAARAKAAASGRARLLADQRRWLIARDRECLAKGKGGGTIAPVLVGQCWVARTRARTRLLTRWR